MNEECAKRAEKLRKQSPAIIFVVGCELTFFMKGLVTGETSFDRMNTFMYFFIPIIYPVLLIFAIAGAAAFIESRID